MPSCLETDLPIFDGEIKGRAPGERSDRFVIIGFKIDQGRKKVKCALLRICHLFYTSDISDFLLIILFLKRQYSRLIGQNRLVISDFCTHKNTLVWYNWEWIDFKQYI